MAGVTGSRSSSIGSSLEQLGVVPDATRVAQSSPGGASGTVRSYWLLKIHLELVVNKSRLVISEMVSLGSNSIIHEQELWSP